MSKPARKAILVSTDAQLVQGMQAPGLANGRIGFEIIVGKVREIVQSAKLNEADILIVDIDATNRDELVALQGIMTRFPGTLPVIVLCESFDEAVGRWFLQIRVSDFLRKPVRPSDIVAACINVLGAGEQLPIRKSEIFSFIAAAGGVGNTTLAVETAIQFAAGGPNGNSTCIVDLDVHNDSCASHLDIEPRLDVAEIGRNGERLDAQLMEVMGSKHESGLVLFGAVTKPGHDADITGEAILRLLDVISTRFERVVLDLPRTWQDWTPDVLRGSDKIYVVTDMTVPGLRSARRTVQRIMDKVAPENGPLVIVNRAEKQGFFSSGLRNTDAERVLENNFAGTVGNNYGLVREAIDRGVPLEKVKPGNNVTADLRRILFAA